MSAPGAGERPAWTIRRRDATDSTQRDARRALAAGEGLDRVAFVADLQRGGVGRFGRPFASPLGGAWQTLVVADADRRWSDGRLAPALAVALAEALSGRGRALGLKWPNDLWREGRKCGGILTERVRGHLLVGVGLNAVNEPPPGFARLDLPPDEVRATVREALDGVLAAWPPRDLADRWSRFDLLRGRVVTVAGVRGPVAGVADDGALLVHDAAGTVVAIRSGSVRDVDPPLGRRGEPPGAPAGRHSS